MSKFFKGKNKLKITPQQGPRPIDVVQKEYLQFACDLGNVEYQIKTLEVQKGSLVARMSELSLEATMLNQKESQDETGTSQDNQPTDRI